MNNYTWWKRLLRVLYAFGGVIVSPLILLWGVNMYMYSYSSFIKFAVSVPVIVFSSLFFIYSVVELVARVVGQDGYVPGRMKDKK